jgi:hypothetical protein
MLSLAWWSKAGLNRRKAGYRFHRGPSSMRLMLSTVYGKHCGADMIVVVLLL